MRAMTAAPMSPAAPSCAAWVDAALLVVAGFVVVGLPAEGEEEEGEEEEVRVPALFVVRAVVTAGLVGVEVTLALVAPAVVGLAVVGPVEPEPEPEEVGFFPIQLVSDPLLMVNGADCAVVPVESRMVRPMDTPPAILAIHVRELLVVEGKVTRAAAPGWLPGRILTKYGA